MAENDNFDWLTYETIFQQLRFARTNEKLEIGLYAIQRDAVTVFFRSDIGDELLTKLTDAFFPDVADAKAHMEDSDSNWPWKQQAAVAIAAPLSPVAAAIPVSGAVNRLFLNQYVVLPYNNLDNDKRSEALGTSENPQVKQLAADRKWDFWKTASRSCVMRLTRKKAAGEDWAAVFRPAWQEWNFDEGFDARKNFRLPAGPPSAGYSLASKASTDFSVKTGVVWVGSEDQKKAEKDNLDSNWIIACLRSDYVAAVNKEMGIDPGTDPELVVLTELLSVNEKSTVRGKSDGVQVRDLSLLKTNCIYVPPLSIPVIDNDFNSRSSEFVNLTDPTWCDLWRRSWAGSLGRAKALFLLRYGLQHINPNVQNYLIEFSPGGGVPKPTGRIVIRDLQDAALQREVVWALYGPDQPPPTDKKDLQRLRLDVLSHEFTDAVIGDSQETGTTNPQFGPPGLHFLWNRFSMFGGNNKSEEFVSRMLREGNSETFEKIAAADFAELQAMQSPIESWPESEFKKYADYSEELEDDEDRRKVRLYAANRNDPAALKIHFPNMIQSRKFKSTVDAILQQASEKVVRKKADVVIKTRKLLLAVMAEWGRTHNLEYVHTAEKLLGVNFGIDWTTLPDPARHLLDGEIDFKSELAWEETNAKVLQGYIASTEGQEKVRQYKARGWRPAKSVFGLQVLDKKSVPLEHSRVKILCDNPQRRWIDLTDRQGLVHVYEGNADDFHFEIMDFPDLAGGTFKIKELKNNPSGPIYHFDFLKVKFVAG